MEFPALSGVQRESPEVVRPGDTVGYRFIATPGTEPIEAVRFHFRAETSKTSRVLSTSDAASGRVSAVLDAPWVDDTYALVGITVADTWGRTVTYGGEGQVTAGAFNLQRQNLFTGPATHAMDFVDLSFAVTGGLRQPPRSDLSEVTLLSSSPVTPGQTVRYRTRGVAGIVPLARITFTFGLGFSTTEVFTFTAEATSPNAEYAFTIPGGLAIGTYRLVSVLTTDREGRGVLYESDGRAIESVVGGASYADESSVFFGEGFRLEGGSTSHPGARLTGWERETPEDVAPGGAVRFAIATGNGAFPVQDIALRLVGPYGSSRTITLNGSTGTVSVPVSADWLSGAYSIGVITLTDTLGRRVSYLPFGGTAFLGGTTISGAPFPRERFAFTVRGGREVRPYFVIQPAATTVLLPGRSYVTLTAQVTGFMPTAYQWFRGEVGDTSRPIPAEFVRNTVRGVESFTELGVDVATPTTFWVRALGSGVTVDSAAARVLTHPADYGRFTNLSLLTPLADAADNVTLGFVVGGDGASGEKRILARAAGPSLTGFGIGDAVTDPRLAVFLGSSLLGENEDWGGGANLATAMAGVGAFAYASPASRDAAALITTLPGGNYSMRVSGNTAGRALAEVYDVGPSPVAVASAPRLANVSVLKQLREGFTVGFAIAGTSPIKVLIRAVGPSLGQPPLNVSGTVEDPRMVLYRGETPFAVADNWQDSFGEPAATFRAVGAFALLERSKDAVLVRELAPGSYTVQVRSKGGGGLVLLEVYHVP
jgi:hypothetical protein